jgi:hypothetical protein
MLNAKYCELCEIIEQNEIFQKSTRDRRKYKKSMSFEKVL